MKPRKSIAIVPLIAFLSLAFGQDWKHYNENPDFKLTTLPNGSISNVASLSKLGPIIRMGAKINHDQVTDNVWFIGGDAYAPVVIELDDGLIAVSTGEHAGDGRKYRKYIRQHISKKPIIGVLYDHSHYIAGTKTLLDGDEAIIVAHPDLNDIVSARSGDGQANAAIDEMQPHMASRALIHYGNHNPETGPDAPATPLVVELGHESAWLPATHTLKHGESVTIGGLEIVAYHHITDTKDTLTFHIPEYKMVIDNVVWPASNMYTLRGDAYRDPSTWSQGLREIRDLEPEYLLSVGAGAKAVVGKEKIREIINASLDARNFTYDQAIRLTNMGVPASQLKHYMSLPESLRSHPYVNNAYGQFETFAQAYPTHNHGYFSGNPEEIHNLPKPVHARYIIKLAGGVGAAHKSWEKAMANGEYLWAKELAVALYYNAPSNKQARQALAGTLRKLGQNSEGSIVRNFYIAGAMSLEGNEAITLSGTQNADWVEAEPETAVNYLRTRINPNRATGVAGKLVFDIDGKRYGLEMRNATAEFSTKPASDAHVIKVTAKDFAKYYLGELKAAQIASGKALDLLRVFDEFKPIPMYPMNFDHLK